MEMDKTTKIKKSMRIVHLGQDSAQSLPPSVATVGFFDGVHRGHQYLIGQVVDEAHRFGLTSTVITFDRHPRQVLHKDYQPRLLSTLDEKLQLLSLTGIDNVVVLHFTPAMAALTARQFMQDVLSRQLRVQRLVIGYDNRFGHDRSEGFDDYVNYGAEIGITVTRSQPLLLHSVKISSSVVRSFLQEGEVDMARQCLGYPYTLIGRVVDGVKEGRELGYPTANIEVTDAEKLIPAQGVYGVLASAEGLMANMPAMTNIGTRPTFDGQRVTIETHILHFHRNLYGKILRLAFCHRIRSERKFASAVQLARQLDEDRKQTEQLFKQYGK